MGANTMTALQELLPKVEAGEWDWMIDWPDWDCRYMPSIGLFIEAYNGSLDAAKALHEAALHEWEWQIGSEDAYLETGDPGNEWTFRTASADNIDPARAWLIAIIKALIAQEKTP
jgi:hypothetical protein